jgi:Uma2 family endonuclease
MLRHHTLAPIPDDTEDAPWMTMSDWQYGAVDAFMAALEVHVESLSPRPYVAAMLPIRYHPNPGDPHIEQLSPDALVAPVSPTRHRDSHVVDTEGVPPSVVLEVVSPSSLERDQVVKPERYEAMGIWEYVLFDPQHRFLTPALQGYRREATSGGFVPWVPDAQGRLWSEVLGVWLVAVGEELRLQRGDGSLVPLPRESRAERDQAIHAWREEALARQRAEEERQQEALARREAEAEVARLRAELERRGRQ